MESSIKSTKRKKSGAENGKASKARREENEKLGTFMKNYFTKSSKSYEDDASSNDREPLNAAENKNKENKDVKDGIENTSPDIPYDVDDENNAENEVEVAQDFVNFSEFDSGRKVGQEKVQDDEMEVEKSAVSSLSCAETGASELDSESSADGGVIGDRFTEEDTVDGFTKEDTVIIEQHMLQGNPAILNKAGNETNDPALLVGMKFSIEEKEKLCKNEPCQPPESVLCERKKKIGERNRYCSQAVFFHEDQTRRKWLSYSLSKDCLFCLPCLLFSDESLRGENVRHNQGNAFTKAGYSNWKKQYSNIAKHEKSESHISAKIAKVVFLQGRSQFMLGATRKNRNFASEERSPG